MRRHLWYLDDDIPECDRGILLPPEGAILSDIWQSHPYNSDGTISLVLLNWLEDHYSDLIEYNRRESLSRVMDDLARRVNQNLDQ